MLFETEEIKKNTPQADEPGDEIIEAEFQSVNIDSFDSTQKTFSFRYGALALSKQNPEDKDTIDSLRRKLEESYKQLGIRLKYSGITAGPRLVRLEYHFPEDTQLREIEKHREEVRRISCTCLGS